MQWRLRFDVPISLASEPGLFRALHSADYAPLSDSHAGTWRDPVSRLVMLRPNWLDRDYYSGLQPLSSWFHKTAGWRALKRSRDQAAFMGTVKAASWTPADVDLGLPIGLPVDAANPGAEDTLVWALASGFVLSADEAFVIHYHTATDEHARKNNWIAVQWWDCLVHLSMQGRARVYQYADPSALNAEPALAGEFEFAQPGELNNSAGYIVLQPIPSLGLAVYHSGAAPQQPMRPANARAATFRGELVPWPGRLDGWWSMFSESPVRIAVNPYMPVVLAFQRVRFTPSGTFTDAPFDPHFSPQTTPFEVVPVPLNTASQSITASLMNAQGTAAWTPGVDRQGRVRMTLAGDSIHTPFAYGYYVNWTPVFQTRGTTPYQPRVMRLEWSYDCLGRFDGQAECLMEGAQGRAIAERGDATFVVENSTDGAVWTPVFGGFARDWQLDAAYDITGYYYRARCALRDMHHRLGEVHQNLQTAFDGLKVGSAISLALQGGGFPPLAAIPERAQEIEVPRPIAGQAWRYAPQLGDSGEDIIRALLALLRRQGEEWRLVFDWASFTWVLEQRDHDETGATRWSLVPRSASENLAAMKVRYTALDGRVEPPEANIIVAVGASEDHTHGARIASPPLYNQDSIAAAASPDYLGRAVLLLAAVAERATQGEVNLAARRIYDAAAHRRTQWRVAVPVYAAISPDQPVRIHGAPAEGQPDGAVVADGWVKRMTVTVEGGGVGGFLEKVEYEVDTMWEAEDL